MQRSHNRNVRPPSPTLPVVDFHADDDCPECDGIGTLPVECDCCDGVGCDDENEPCGCCEGEGEVIEDCSECNGTGKVAVTDG